MMSETEARSKSPIRFRIILACLFVLAILIASGAYLYIRLSQSPIPRGIESQLNFSPYIVTNNRGGGVVATSYKYDSQNKFLSFVLTYGKLSFTVSEQSSPDEFTDVPDAYQSLLNQMQSYDTVQTFNGPLALSHPNSDSLTTGLLNQNGVLMFIKSGQQNVSDDIWRQVVESMDIYKISN